jgi:hypothetical protein
MLAMVLQPRSIDGSDVQGTRQDGSDGTETIVDTGHSLPEVACKGRVGSRRWVFDDERTRSVGLASSEDHNKIPKKKKINKKILTSKMISRN